MSYRVTALYAHGGQAALCDEQTQQWYLVSIDNNWVPVEMRDEREVMAWSMHVSAEAIETVFETLEDAVTYAREQCEAQMEAPQVSMTDVEHLLANRKPAPVSRENAADRRPPQG